MFIHTGICKYIDPKSSRKFAYMHLGQQQFNEQIYRPCKTFKALPLKCVEFFCLGFLRGGESDIAQ